MPHTNLEKRREYLKLYMREHRQVLTPEQKAKKSAYMKKYAEENATKLAEYQKERWLKDKEKISERKKKFAQAHPEIIKARSKKYYEENKEAIKKAVEEYRDKNIDSIRTNARKYRNSPKGRLKSYQASAKERGYDFSLTTDEFNTLLFKECHYCGQPESMGIDRKDSSIGYFSYNVVPCCKTCNFMKGTLSYPEFYGHIRKIINRLKVE